MRRGIQIVAGLAIVFAPLPAAAQSGGSSVTFVETFETGGNEGGWSFGNAFESITQDGARSGSFLRNVFLDSIPFIRGVPVMENWVDVESIVGEELENAFYGKTSVDDVIVNSLTRTKEYFR